MGEHGEDGGGWEGQRRGVRMRAREALAATSAPAKAARPACEDDKWRDRRGDGAGAGEAGAPPAGLESVPAGAGAGRERKNTVSDSATSARRRCRAGPSSAAKATAAVRRLPGPGITRRPVRDLKTGTHTGRQTRKRGTGTRRAQSGWKATNTGGGGSTRTTDTEIVFFFCFSFPGY